jgi:hypothetical protein
MTRKELGLEKRQIMRKVFGDIWCVTGPPVASIRMRRQDKTHKTCVDNACTILYQ